MHVKRPLLVMWHAYGRLSVSAELLIFCGCFQYRLPNKPLRSSIESALPGAHRKEDPAPSREERLPTSLDVEEVHHIFKLRDMHVTDVVDGLAAAASNGRVSWVPFARYMCSLAASRPPRVDSSAALTTARRIFNVFDVEQQQEVDLRELASGLSVSVKILAQFLASGALAALREDTSTVSVN